MRLFVAITPPEEIRLQLRKVASGIERARWVKPSQLHVTLRFLGEVDEEVARTVEETLGAIVRPKFQLTVDGAGSFGRPPRVIWMGLDPDEELRLLASAVEAQVVAAGLEPETRDFSPHLTLARLKNSSPVQVRRRLDELNVLKLGPFEVESFVLYSSVLSSAGAEHEVIRTYPLADRS